MRRQRILVVDDEPGMLRSLDRILRNTYQVRVSQAPSEALRIAERFRPDLALLDVRMPEMSGFELLDELK